MAVSSEFVAYAIAGYVFEKLGTRVALMSFYAIAGVGAVLMLSYGLAHTDTIAFPILFLLCRFGISGVYILFIAANAKIFDTERSASALGLGSFFGRLVLSGAPLASTLKQPVPMYIFFFSCASALCFTYFIKVHPKLENKAKKVTPVEEPE